MDKNDRLLERNRFFFDQREKFLKAHIRKTDLLIVLAVGNVPDQRKGDWLGRLRVLLRRRTSRKEQTEHQNNAQNWRVCLIAHSASEANCDRSDKIVNYSRAATG